MASAFEQRELLSAAGAFAASLLVGILARSTVLRRMGAFAGRTESKVDDALVASLGRPIPVWFALGGAYIASRLVTLPPSLTEVGSKLLAAAAIVSLTFWIADLGLRLLGLVFSSHGTPVTGAVRNVVRIGVLAVGGLVLLATLGISVAPVLTTIGIGGLAVALGLQDTLANLFAGLHLTLAGNIRVGDFIKLESGEEGYVEDIRWRATRIRTLPNNCVLIPNSRLAQNIVTNFHLPAKDLAVLVQVGVHYASDLEKVEQVTREVARDVMKSVAGGVDDFDPFIRYHTFAQSSVDFTVILRANEFTDTFIVKHEFIKRLAKRFARDGIVIPYPIRAINLEQERVTMEGGKSAVNIGGRSRERLSPPKAG